MIKIYIEQILRDSNKLIIVNFFLKGIALILLYFALQGQSIGYYSFLRWVLFPLFLLLAFISQKRGKSYSIYIWVFLASIFNPFLPFYLKDFGIWQALDSIAIITIFVTLFIHDFTCYNFSLEIADHIHRTLLESSNDILYYLNYYAEKYYIDGINLEDSNIKKRHLNISIDLFKILIRYQRNNPEFHIKMGIVESRIYHFSHSLGSFEFANRSDQRFKIPTKDEIYKLTFDNFKDILYLSE